MMNQHTQSKTELQRGQILTGLFAFFITLLKLRWLRLLLCSALLLFGVVRPFVFRSYVIPSGSMMNTLLPGDRVLVCKFFYGVRMPYFRWKLLSGRQPKHSDICVAHLTTDYLGGQKPFDVIKRIAGLPGDVIEIRAGKVIRNGNRVDEPYARHSVVTQPANSPAHDHGPYQVPKDHVFLIGDNRDATWMGIVPMKNLEGPAWLIYWSWDSTADFWHRLRFRRISWL